MKILWVVNHYMADLANELGEIAPISGSWLVEISKILSSLNDVELNIVCPSHYKTNMIKINKINYYLLKMSSIDRFIKPGNELINSSFNLIEEVGPDIIHIQGSEFAFGLAFLEQTKIPVVISIQGLISEIIKNDYSWGGINNRNIIKYLFPNNITVYLPQFLKNLRNKFRAKSEIKQLKKCEYIIGRTTWDKAHSYFYNSGSKYYFLQETIRTIFFQINWNVETMNKHTIFCGGGYGSPLKGAHKILEAIILLKNEFPNIQVRFPGIDPRCSKNRYGYNKFLVNYIEKLNINQNIYFTGVLNDKQMAIEFSKANVYVMGSSIENSSNTMGEAMCIGIPSVISYVGGLPSLANDEKEVLFYRFGDVEQMAWQIRSIFLDEELAVKLSENSKKRAKIQYPTEDISKNLKLIYEDIINLSSKSND